MSEYDHEPVRGLPGILPQDEYILWQGAPDWRHMAVSALHVRLAAGYFVAVAAWAGFRGDLKGVGIAMLMGAALVGLLALFAWGVGRTTVYTLTTKRLVLRIGVALNKCINLPLGEIEAANLKLVGGGHGNIVLSLKGLPRLGYWMLWPHSRSLRIVRPQPMLRAIPDASTVAETLLQAAQKVQAVAPATTPSRIRQDIPLEGVPA
jgi:hypothetical protein